MRTPMTSPDPFVQPTPFLAPEEAKSRGATKGAPPLGAGGVPGHWRRVEESDIFDYAWLLRIDLQTAHPILLWRHIIFQRLRTIQKPENTLSKK